MAGSNDKDWQQLLEEAAQYERIGDVYLAVKLYKRLIRLDAERVEPYRQLGLLYQQRREWKPAFYYHKKAASLDPTNRDIWWGLGIAATGLHKLKLAGSVWAKFGQAAISPSPEGLRLAYDGGFEILWINAIDPARAQIQSIPHPASGYRYREILLYKRAPVGYHVVNRRRVPVYDELGSWKKSPFQTFSCLLHTESTAAILRLEELCRQAGLGFEQWSNATRSLVINHPKAFPEFYGRNVLPASPAEPHCLVAIAALHQAEVQHILNNWQIVTLAQYSDLRGY